MELQQLNEVENEEELVDELADALRDMAQKTCRDMMFLWLDLTEDLREDFDCDGSFPDTSGVPGYAERSASWKSKYKALAGWRHAVVWQALETEGLPETIDDWEPDDDDVVAELEQYPVRTREAMRRIYFQEYPRNESPYSWSKKTSEIIDDPNESVDNLRLEAMRGCWSSLQMLERIWSETSLRKRSEFLYLGMRGTLSDLLKFDDRREDAESGDAPAWMTRFEWYKPDKPEPSPRRLD
jgi:hypothetical protein